MQEISFSIPVSGMIRIDESSITVTVNRAETTITLEHVPKKEDRMTLEKGKTIFDIVLGTARDLVKRTEENQFSAAQLYHDALERYPNLKRNTWASHVIACAPNHPSHKHYTSKRNYFSYMGQGLYRLSGDYVPEDTSD